MGGLIQLCEDLDTHNHILPTDQTSRREKSYRKTKQE